MPLTSKIKNKAFELGFELVGIAPAEPVPELDFYKDWIEAGYAGKMAYLGKNLEKRTDLGNVVPDAKSVIVCALIYDTDQPLSIEFTDSDRGWISRYAWGDDYHQLIESKLFELRDFIRDESSEIMLDRVYVDTGPVVDRVYAKYAGIGWFGKNTCIINQQKGSWFFLGEIITNLELEYDSPVPDRCGTCNLCIEACPTDAILEPYVLDSRRCISYLTIELRDEIPNEHRDGIGNHIFGCDICQDVCPWNRDASKTNEMSLAPRPGLLNPALEEMATMTIEEFREKFSKSAVKRTKHRGFIRNVAVAMGNSGSVKFLPLLDELSNDEDELIASHAAWALDKIRSRQESTQSPVKEVYEYLLS